jgi:cell division protein FtsW
VVLGVAALLLTISIDYRRLRSLAGPGIILAFLLLLAVLLIGHSVSGGQRWLSFGPFSFQPSELVKLLLIIYFARWLVRRGELVQSLSNGLVPFVMLLGSILLFVVLQNDVGTSLVIAFIGLAMFYAAGARLSHVLIALASGACSYLVIIVATSFRRDRFLAFLHPLPPGCGGTSSYQLCQGLISLGSGGITGRGLGDSIQHRRGTRAAWLCGDYYTVCHHYVPGPADRSPCERSIWIARGMRHYVLVCYTGGHQYWVSR